MQWSEGGETFLSGFVLQAVLDILWGSKALVVEEDGELHQRRGKLDEADSLYVRCLMRKYGWDIEGQDSMFCSWMQCFVPRTYSKMKLKDFAWFVMLELLHPRTSDALEAVRAHHDPSHVRELRASRLVVS